MRSAPALIVLAASAATSFAQLGNGDIWYEASLDGQFWQRGYLLTGFETPTNVYVRLRASWSGDAGMYAFAASNFDVQITDAEQDTVSDMLRPRPFGSVAQTIAATRFGSTIKIDDSRDTLAPGQGTRGVFPSQLAQQLAGTNFTSANPVTIFQFTLTMNQTSIRRITSLYVPPTGGGDPVPMRVFTSPRGSQNNPTTITHAITIDNYTPAPGPTALLGLWGAAASRRPTRSRPRAECAPSA